MQYTGLNELREKYLSFFESKEHLRMKSFSLVPQGDNSLLLINAGMAPLKPYFTGAEVPPRKRVTTCQKCIRTLDIDRVGKTARHGSFFEMLGNFSFGDYFKEQAISWAWEFLTKILEIPENLLWPSIFEDDEEAFEIWRKVGVPAERIVRLGRDDNFWELGSGPCGPCSEIYFDRGEKYGCGSPDCKPGCDCDRFMEIWNNVFSQFNSDGCGNYTELEHKNIDTGMGLERLACVMQGVDNLFEVDTVRAILDKVCEIAGVKYGDDYKSDVSIRVITDHIRGTTFLISDGVVPTNEGRGYVLRRIIRRAARHGKLLGIGRTFLCELCDVVIDCSKGAYPELEEKREYIKKIIKNEEDRFDATIDSGLQILENIFTQMEQSGEKVLTGENCFKLYDTYGFPLDLTAELAAEKNISIDEDGFNDLMERQRVRAREARQQGSGWDSAKDLELDDLVATEFVGYGNDSCEAGVIALIVDGERVDSVSEGEFIAILDTTPFYGESGGQVGDTGKLSLGAFEAEVTDTKKTKSGHFMHVSTVKSGAVSVGDRVFAAIDVERRAAIRRNHTSVHLLQAALREILGKHVEQAGSYVDESRFRFDFKHFSAMTEDEIAQVEDRINDKIFEAIQVETIVTDRESSKKMGAMALFGEKYGDRVRMVKIGDFSTELCGGTHIDNIAKIGLCKLVSETGVSAGVRRIEGVTGKNVMALLKTGEAEIGEACAALKVSNSSELVNRCNQIMAELHEKDKKIEELSGTIAKMNVESMSSGAKEIGGLAFYTNIMKNASSDTLRDMCDKLKSENENCVACFISDNGDSASIVCAAGKGAISMGIHAGKLASMVAAIAGGKGGGRPDFAMAGAKDISKLEEALAGVEELALSMKG